MARDAKAGNAALIPLRDDPVEDVRGWVAEKLEALPGEAEEKGTPLPLNLPAHEPLFLVPRNLIKGLKLDSPYGERQPASRERASAAGRSTCTHCAAPSAPTCLRGP